jgi:ureidoglycolate lyase
MHRLKIQPLTADAFAPFGDVIAPREEAKVYINNGTTERFHALASAEVAGTGARVIINIFRGQPRQFPYSVTMMERHPYGSQSFSPLNGQSFLVVVAEDKDGEPGEPQVFLAKGGQGVNYHRNVWHHPLMTLNVVADFLVVDRTGEELNLQEVDYPEAYMIEEPEL